jgi:agmatine deiminase
MSMATAGDLGFAQPAEWAPHAACWVAWPCAEHLWLDNLGPARRAWVAMARAIADGGSAQGAGRSTPGAERLVVLVPDEAQERLAKDALSGVEARFHRVPFGDIWMRDIAPIFVKNARGEVATARFRFNGWGGKYVLPHDDRVAERVARLAGLRELSSSWVLEGGSLDVDGEGTCLTTRQCLLNPNRNPAMDQAAIESALRDSLGVQTVVWLGDGLANDHTDGHVDNIARFVAPGVALCMEARDAEDPNREALDAIARDLAAAKDARGRKLQVVRIPSPGRVEDEEGEVVPASFANFYVGNRSVVVPTYGTKWDDEAVEKIGALFPGRRAVGVNARAILTGGGAFHCVTQQEPKAGA